MTTNRKLAAILAADVVGFSTMMQADEAGTMAALKQRRKEILEPLVAKHRGRLVKVMGDGVLIEFASAVSAVQCAVELQQAMSATNAANDPNGNNDKNVLLRIGVNLGDVLVEGSDLYGDGVNVAARLEALAEPGTVCISAKVREEVEGKLELIMEDRGEVRLKNMPRSMRVFRISPCADLIGRARGNPEALPLPDKPSIAVLPFKNLSTDPEQDYFADGMVEEIIMALSRMRWLFVIASASSFAYKGRAVDVKQVGRELGVRYVLEGSVRTAGSKLRIAGQLIDAGSGAHLWADRFEGTHEDLFDLQDQVTTNVIGAITPKLEQAEIERAKRKPTDSLDAYDYFLRGMAAYHLWTREGHDEALSNFLRAIEIDADFASAYGMAAACYPLRKTSGWVLDPIREPVEAERLARRAAELAGEDALALCTAGFVIGFVAGDLDSGASLIDRGLQINPNLAWGWLFSGWMKILLGMPEIALEDIERATRLNPHNPQLFQMQAANSYAYFCAGRYVEAVFWAEKALLLRPNYITACRVLAASYALAGHDEQASRVMVRLRQLDPGLRVSNLKDTWHFRPPGYAARFAEGLRKAGLPE